MKPILRGAAPPGELEERRRAHFGMQSGDAGARLVTFPHAGRPLAITRGVTSAGCAAGAAGEFAGAAT